MSLEADAPVLVTGGAGLLGTAVVEALLAAGRSVICLDLRAPANGSRPALESVIGDVRDRELVEREVARSERVVHLAAIVGVDEYLRDPLGVLDVGILGSRNVLAACAAHARPVVIASTSEVYGKNPGDLAESSDTILGPPSLRRWSYASSKLAAEHFAFALGGEGLCFSIARYFNVYGPLLDRPGGRRVVSKFLSAIQRGEPLVLVEGGNAVRSFCYVRDAAAATTALALSLGPASRVTGRAFNVGRREPVTIRELAELMIELSGHRAGVREASAREHLGEGFEEIPRRVPDVSALADAIGFEATVSLRDGIAETLRHWGLLAEPSPSAALPSSVIPMVRPIFEPSQELDRNIHASLSSGRVTNSGPLVLRFESELEAFLGAPVAVVSSGSMALLLTAKALGLQGKVVLPAYTYIATLAAFVHLGMEPLLCDVDPRTFTLSPDALARIVESTAGIGAIVPVNVFGVPPELDPIVELAARVGATVVYDNAHGFGTEQRGRKLPAGPAATCLSFHATKTLPAVEGGAVVSDNRHLVDEVRRLSQHGLARNLLASTPGYNARLDELRAAVGLQSLAGFADASARRRSYAERLRACLADTGGAWTPQLVPPDVRSSFQNFAALAPVSEARDLDAVIASLRAHGVEARRYFFPPLHQLDAYRGRFALPVTERIAATNLCLPLHDRMDDSTQARIERALIAVARESA